MEFASFTKWTELPKDIDKLLLESEKKSIFFSKTWLEKLATKNLKEEQSLFLACVLKDNEIVVFLPMTKDSGNHIRSLRHLYTSLFTIIVKENSNQEVFHCLVEGLNKSSIKSIKLDPIDENDHNVKQFQNSLELSGFICFRHFLFYNWIYKTNKNSFKIYNETRPSKLRNTVERKLKKLKREASYEILIYSKKNILKALEEYYFVHERSWKAKELFKNFIESLVLEFSKKNKIRLGILYINNQPAAAQIWFICEQKASIFKLVYDENWKQYSPGSILMSHFIENMIDVEKVKVIDFLYGNDAYKRDWMSNRLVRQSLYSAKVNDESAIQIRLKKFIFKIKDINKFFIKKFMVLWHKK